jgi:hypothetical protein
LCWICSDCTQTGPRQPDTLRHTDCYADRDGNSDPYAPDSNRYNHQYIHAYLHTITYHNTIALLLSNLIPASNINSISHINSHVHTIVYPVVDPERNIHTFHHGVCSLPDTVKYIPARGYSIT